MKRLFPLFLVVLGLLAFSAFPASATHAWADYHWARTANPVQLKVNASITSDWSTRTDAVIADWDKSTVLSLTRVASDTSSQTRRKCPAISGQLRVCNQTYGFNGWLGLATIHIDANHHILDGTEKLNDSYFDGTSTYNTETERRHVECQEIGHTFGLDHQSTDGTSLNTCMDYYVNTSNSDTKSTTPNQHDYDELAIIYSHTDSYNTFSAAAVAVAPLGPINENSSLSVTRDGDMFTYTWILWADPNITARAIAGLPI